MNRLKDLLGPPPPEEPEREGDYWLVEARHAEYVVSQATAAAVELALDASPPPRWVAFRDLTGARHRLLAVDVARVSECTAEQRAAERAFYRARRLEAKADRRPWEDDDYPL